MKKKITKVNIEQYMRLQKYLIELHKTGKVCVSVDMSGHVDWVSIHIMPSQEEYLTSLYEKQTWVQYLSKKMVDSIIEDIKKVIDNLDAKKKEIAAEKEQ